ncbi:hypothetical protein GGR56DRAFT_670924 [Xylariaceae sp. FL0804]|nr:hypothetical protein GGR56DRAFT_670924 [Xylariaceae sp. FL0804]
MSASSDTRGRTKSAISVMPRPEAGPTVAVHIDNHYRSKIYTTASEVAGHVEVSSGAAADVPFDSVQVLLLGTSRTRVDAVNIPQATSHTFLRLSMPVAPTAYPAPRVLPPGGSGTGTGGTAGGGAPLRVPFRFVVPAHLTLGACGHRVSSPAVRDHHLRLPPSLGGGTWERDDGAPNMARVSYCVRARLLGPSSITTRREREQQQQRQLRGEDDDDARAPLHVQVLAEAAVEVRVLPATSEDAPLSVAEYDRLYALSGARWLRASMLSPARVGRVSVTAAAQPAPAVLSADGRVAAPTTARLALAYEPSSSSSSSSAGAGAGARAPPPPRVVAVSAKVATVTYYSAGAITHYPNLRDWSRSFGADGRGCYTTSVAVPMPAAEWPVVWQQQEQQQQNATAGAPARRDSGYGSDDNDDGDKGDKGEQRSNSVAKSSSSPGTALVTALLGGGKKQKQKQKKERALSPSCTQTATLEVPIQLPAHKRQFLPTFHGCISSRVYVLSLTVSLAAGTATTGTTTGTTTPTAHPYQQQVTVHVPLQVAVEEAASSLTTTTTTTTTGFTASSPATAAVQAAARRNEPPTDADAADAPPPSFDSVAAAVVVADADDGDDYEADADAILRPRSVLRPATNAAAGAGCARRGAWVDALSAGLPGYAEVEGAGAGGRLAARVAR